MNDLRSASDSDRLAALESSVRQLHTQNRRLRLALYGAVTAISLVSVLGVSAVKAQDAGTKVVAQRVTIVDADQKPLLELGSFEKGAGLVVYGANGSKSLLLGVSHADKSPGMLMLDSEGNPRIGVGLKEGIPSVALSDSKGNTRIGIGVGKDNHYGLVTYDANQVERAGIGMGKNGPFCVMLDAEGKPRVGMGQDASGKFVMAGADGAGAEAAGK